MVNQGFAEIDAGNQLLIAPETFAAPPESLTEQLFIERSLTENNRNPHGKNTWSWCKGQLTIKMNEKNTIFS